MREEVDDLCPPNLKKQETNHHVYPLGWDPLGVTVSSKSGQQPLLLRIHLRLQCTTFIVSSNSRAVHESGVKASSLLRTVWKIQLGTTI